LFCKVLNVTNTDLSQPIRWHVKINPALLLNGLYIFSSFWRFFFSWMCIRVFFSSVHFHLFNHSELLAAYITCPCFLFMLSACQVIRQMHQIDSKSPHLLYISLLLLINSLHSIRYSLLWLDPSIAKTGETKLLPILFQISI
jgi:hypothetical protein